jgi:hypothetical protein
MENLYCLYRRKIPKNMLRTRSLPCAWKHYSQNGSHLEKWHFLANFSSGSPRNCNLVGLGLIIKVIAIANSGRLNLFGGDGLSSGFCLPYQFCYTHIHNCNSCEILGSKLTYLMLSKILDIIKDHSSQVSLTVVHVIYNPLILQL